MHADLETAMSKTPSLKPKKQHRLPHTGEAQRDVNVFLWSKHNFGRIGKNKQQLIPPPRWLQPETAHLQGSTTETK